MNTLLKRFADRLPNPAVIVLVVVHVIAVGWVWMVAEPQYWTSNIYIYVFVSQLSLLGIWAALGSSFGPIRWLSLFLYLELIYRRFGSSGSPPPEEPFVGAVEVIFEAVAYSAGLIVLLFGTIVLWLSVRITRFKLIWDLKRPRGFVNGPWQFSIQNILTWTAYTAMLVTTVLNLHISKSLKLFLLFRYIQSPEFYGFIAPVAVIQACIVLTATWTLFTIGSKSGLRSCPRSIWVTSLVLGGSGLGAFYLTQGHVIEFINWYVLPQIIVLSASLALVRWGGYRLVPRENGAETPAQIT